MLIKIQFLNFCFWHKETLLIFCIIANNYCILQNDKKFCLSWLLLCLQKTTRHAKAPSEYSSVSKHSSVLILTTFSPFSLSYCPRNPFSIMWSKVLRAGFFVLLLIQRECCKVFTSQYIWYRFLVDISYSTKKISFQS